MCSLVIRKSFQSLLHTFDFPGGSDGKGSDCNAGDVGLIPGLGRFPGRKWQPTPVLLPRKSHGQRSLVQATVHGVAKSRTQLYK